MKKIVYLHSRFSICPDEHVICFIFAQDIKCWIFSWDEISEEMHHKYCCPLVCIKNYHFIANYARCPPQIQYHRSLDRRSFNTDVQFWAVFGSQDCREKSQAAISMLLLRPVSFLFSRTKNNFRIFQKYPSARTEKLHT